MAKDKKKKTPDFIINQSEKHFPQIYVYEDKKDPGWLKVGYTTRKNAEDRIREQFNTRLQRDSQPYIYHHVEDAIDSNGKPFMDKDVHRVLLSQGFEANEEFFNADLDSVKSAILSVKMNMKLTEKRTQSFGMRIEQETAVNLTETYFKKQLASNLNSKPKFLWNAKMRFGKTFTSYQLAKRMGFTKVLVVTYKPAVEDSWRQDLNSHIDFEGWQFISRKQGNLDSLDKSKSFVYFASFQDLIGKQDNGTTKKHNEWLADVDWDIVIQDEYHYGAWRDSAKELVDSDDLQQLQEEEKYGAEVASKNINAKSYLYLSGTPFRIIDSGEFTEEQIFNWTYADEQRMKAKVAAENPENQMYATLPELAIFTYQLPENLKKVANNGEYDEFSLSYFFKATGEYENAKFVNEGEVQQWLDLIRGATSQDANADEKDIENDLKKKAEGTLSSYPFSKVGEYSTYKVLNHTLWLLPNVASCYAMANLLKDKHNKFYHDYEIIVAAGKDAGSGVDALIPLKEKMGDPLKTKTITLSCGKLTTGVTVAPWTGIFMLRTLSSPETYFQSAFRVQSSWTISDEDPTKGKINLKEKCYVFDFDPNRALSQIEKYATNLDSSNATREEKINEFIKFLPILAHDGFSMEKIDAEGLLDMTISNTTSSLLAKGWNSMTLLDVSPSKMLEITKNEEVMRAINSILSHRKKDIRNDKKTIISSIKSLKKLSTKKQSELSSEEKKELSVEKKKYSKEEKAVKEKLKTLITRIPLFMYLTEHREESLTDIIINLEPELFTKVTEISIDDFKLLIEIGLFNDKQINEAVFRFRRFEDSSLEYTGLSYKGNSEKEEDLCINCKRNKNLDVSQVKDDYELINGKKVYISKNEKSLYCYVCKKDLLNKFKK